MGEVGATRWQDQTGTGTSGKLTGAEIAADLPPDHMPEAEPVGATPAPIAHVVAVMQTRVVRSQTALSPGFGERFWQADHDSFILYVDHAMEAAGSRHAPALGRLKVAVEHGDDRGHRARPAFDQRSFSCFAPRLPRLGPKDGPERRDDRLSQIQGRAVPLVNPAQ